MSKKESSNQISTHLNRWRESFSKVRTYFMKLHSFARYQYDFSVNLKGCSNKLIWTHYINKNQINREKSCKKSVFLKVLCLNLTVGSLICHQANHTISCWLTHWSFLSCHSVCCYQSSLLFFSCVWPDTHLTVIQKNNSGLVAGNRDTGESNLFWTWFIFTC